MSYDMTDAVRELDLPLVEKAVMYALAWHCNGQTGQCNPGIEALIKTTGASRRTIIRARKRLREMGLIDYKETNGRVSNWYKLNIQQCQSDTVNSVRESTNGVRETPKQGSNKEVNKELKPTEDKKRKASPKRARMGNHQLKNNGSRKP